MINNVLSRIAIFFLYILSLFPFWALYLLSDLIYIVLYHIVKYRRQVVADNLARAFPEKSAVERTIIGKQYFKYLSDLIVESVKMISMSKKQAMRHFTYTNVELVEAYFAEGKSVLGAAGHYGNWEMGNVMMTYISKKNLVVYKPLASEVFEKFMGKVRSRYGTIMVPMKLALRKIIEYRREPTLTVLVSDQTPTMNETQYFIDFLGQRTAVFLGIEKIAKTTNYPIVFLDIKVVKRGYYTCTFVPLIEEPAATEAHAVTEAHVRYLEMMIRREPRLWVWSHRRWKFNEEKEWIG